MLIKRTLIQRTTGNPGIALTVTHALGVIPDLVQIMPVSDRSLGRAIVVPLTILTNTVAVVCSIASICTLNVSAFHFSDAPY